MYHEYFGFTGEPFQLTPDARFFFESRTHARAISYLTYGLSKREGFVVITGEVGAGKTTLVEHLTGHLEPGRFTTAKVVTTQLGADDLIRMISASFGLESAGQDKAALLSQLRDFLANAMARTARPLLIIDEVQNLSMSALEELRMLSNFQNGNEALIQTVLLGQPQFRETMANRKLEQLMQRVIAAHHLEPLSSDETRAYIEHRLNQVGWKSDPSIAEEVFGIVHETSGGVPRRINQICDRMLLACYLDELHEVELPLITKVIGEMKREGLLRLTSVQGTPSSPLPPPGTFGR